MILYHWLLVFLAACELRWRSAVLRILIVLLAVAELQIAMGLGPAYRRAVGNQRRVVMPAPPSQPQRLSSDFVGGVRVMDEEARKVLKRANFPLGVIVWLAIYPAVLPTLAKRIRRTTSIKSPSSS